MQVEWGRVTRMLIRALRMRFAVMGFVLWVVLSCFFFFSSRRRHTRFDCDWSSDVCSSDLRNAPWLDGIPPDKRAYYDAVTASYQAVGANGSGGKPPGLACNLGALFGGDRKSVV